MEPTTSTQMLRRLLHHWNYTKDQLIPRCCLPGWEADLLVIRPSGWVEEVEIKISAADFRREFTTKSDKHQDLQMGARVAVGRRCPTGEFVPWRGSRSDEHDPTLFSVRHPLYGETCYVRREGIIRRFWFAFPETLAEKLLPEVPEYCGVLAVNSYTRILREAPRLKSARKITDQERIKALHSTYFRFWKQALCSEADFTLEGAP